MSQLLRAAWLCWLVLCWLVLWCGAAAAQELVVVHEQGSRQLVTVRVLPYRGEPQRGGAGFLVVHLRNHDAAPHQVTLRLRGHQFADHGLDLRRSGELSPTSTAVWHLPLPNVEDGSLRLQLWIDGVEYFHQLAETVRNPQRLLLLSGDTQYGHQLQVAATAVAADLGVSSCPPADLPADWRCYTGFRGVVVDGRAALTEDITEALRRYVAMGGVVWLARVAGLPQAALQERAARCAAAGSNGQFAEGLGRWRLLDDGFDLTGAPALSPQLLRGSLWPLPPGLQVVQPIPGLGEPPLLVFLSLILLFVIVAGPVNMLWLRRRRRPLLLLLTLPALGFGTTLLLLAYGFLHDGLGVRGVVRSFTWLDQQNHEVATIGARSLFAGMSQGRLPVASDTLLLAPAALQRFTNGAPDRYALDADSGQLAAAVLPARTTTLLLTARQGVERGRLRARHRGGDELELANDGVVLPTGEVLVCDLDGTCWLGTAPLLQRCDLAVASSYLRRLVEELQRHDLAPGTEPQPRPGPRRRAAAEPEGLAGLAAALFGTAVPQPGHWYGRVATAPWLPEHGLQVALDRSEHFVVGRLAAEDLQR